MRFRLILILGLVALSAGWALTRPQPVSSDIFDGLTADAANGAYVFAAAGCGSCHAAADGPADLMTGGKEFQSDFGTFVAPNISSNPEHGIGGWTDLELASAIMNGVGRDGAHLYPAFPYTAYAKATPQDIYDLIAHLRTLPAADTPSAPHQLGFPFNQRVALGLWKALNADDAWVLDTSDPQLERGRYLVEALGHCAECHTPRDALGGLQRENWMAGAPNPSGEGRIPNITPAELLWSEADIIAYLQSGFTPAFDVAGGSMAAVIRNSSQLTDDDRAAIAAYLKAIPPVAN